MLASIVASLHRIPQRTRTALICSSIALFAGISTQTASAQAVYTADRTDGFYVFGTVSEVDTDYGLNDRGYIVGGGLTHSLKSRWLVPSIEVRYMNTVGTNITENSFLGGIKVETHFHRFHPYANFLIGIGNINFIPVNFSDNSIAYDAGVGLDYNVYKRFSIKVDAQEQFWKLGQASNELTPTSISAGISYRIPTAFGRNK
jgi:hypothetical protein